MKLPVSHPDGRWRDDYVRSIQFLELYRCLLCKVSVNLVCRYAWSVSTVQSCSGGASVTLLARPSTHNVGVGQYCFASRASVVVCNTHSTAQRNSPGAARGGGPVVLRPVLNITYLVKWMFVVWVTEQRLLSQAAVGPLPSSDELEQRGAGGVAWGGVAQGRACRHHRQIFTDRRQQNQGTRGRLAARSLSHVYHYAIATPVSCV